MPQPSRFRVFLIEARGRQGLLLEKTKAAAANPVRAYYWMEDSGLEPSVELRLLCSHGCHVVDKQDPLECRLVNELMHYCEEAAPCGKPWKEIQCIGRDQGTRGFREDARRYFIPGRHGCLKLLITDYREFYRGLLSPVRGRERVRGRADDFGRLTPAELPSNTAGLYLRHVTHLLQCGITAKPSWFRVGGPLAADILHQQVYRPGELVAAKEMMRKSCWSLLMGPPGSGKSMLVHLLAYDLYEDQEAGVYCFDCAECPGYDPIRLAAEINTYARYCFLENIHVDWGRAESLYARLFPTDCCVLATTRSGLPELLRPCSRILHAGCEMTLRPGAWTEAIVDAFSAAQSRLSLTPETRAELRSAAGNNYRHLAGALESFVARGSEGSVGARMLARIEADLQALEFREMDSWFPTTLVLLAPLHAHHLATAEPYLLQRWHVPAATLTKLVAMGEIKRVLERDHVCYSLPEGSSGELYWDAGIRYRTRHGVPDRLEFLADYGRYGLPNSLRAILVSDDRSYMARISSIRELGLLAEHESSLPAVAQALATCPIGTLDSSIVSQIVRRFSQPEDPAQLGFCLSIIGCYSPDQIHPILADMLGGTWIQEFCSYASDDDITRFGEHLRLPRPVAQQACGEITRAAWALQDKCEVAKLVAVFLALARATDVQVQVPYESRRAIEVALASGVWPRRGHDSQGLWWLLAGAYRVNEVLGDEMWTAIERRIPEHQFRFEGSPREATELICQVRASHPKLRRRLRHSIDFREMGCKLSTWQDEDGVTTCLRDLCRADPFILARVWLEMGASQRVEHAAIEKLTTKAIRRSCGRARRKWWWHTVKGPWCNEAASSAENAFSEYMEWRRLEGLAQARDTWVRCFDTPQGLNALLECFMLLTAPPERGDCCCESGTLRTLLMAKTYGCPNRLRAALESLSGRRDRWLFRTMFMIDAKPQGTEPSFRNVAPAPPAQSISSRGT